MNYINCITSMKPSLVQLGVKEIKQQHLLVRNLLHGVRYMGLLLLLLILQLFHLYLHLPLL
jgi:hypothetical protein